MNLRPYLVVLVAAIASVGLSGDAPEEGSATPPSVEQLEQRFTEELSSLAQKYEDAKSQIHAAWIAKMKAIAAEHVQAGNLSEATRAWENVASDSPEDADARAYFESIGREPVREVRPEEDEPEHLPASMTPAGKWQGAWGTSGRSFALVIDRKGVVRQHTNDPMPITARLTRRGGRLLVLDHRFTFLELVPNGNRLVVLGWSRSDNKDPFRDQPNTVAVLQRAE